MIATFGEALRVKDRSGIWLDVAAGPDPMKAHERTNHPHGPAAILSSVSFVS
jgi:hypothetical protein